MKKIDEQLWWRYLDGDCDDAERLWLESCMAEDAALGEEYQLRRLLHEQLSLIPLEQPPALFAQGVMESLPLEIEEGKEVVNPKWVRAFWWVLGGILLGSVLASGMLPHGSGAEYPALVAAFKESMVWVTEPSLVFGMCILFGGTLLLSLDQLLGYQVVK
jgi:hypothetical protein